MSSVWSPASIFTSGEPGWMYDNSDMSTLFQDSAGTTPVTAVGQPVGLQLDKSKGLVLGPELVTNGDFSAGSTGWTVPAGWSITDGVAVASVTSASLLSGSNVTAGRSYRVEFDVVSYTSGTLYVRVGAGAAATTSSSGRKSFILTATTTAGVEFYGGTISATIDNISVKEIAGTHRYQSTAASRPTFARLPVTGRRNLLKYTEQFDNAAWASIAATVSADTTVAPDGSTTADKIVATATTGYHDRYQVYTTVAGTYVVSIYAKAAEYSKLKVAESSLGAFAAQFDLASGTLIALTAGTSASITRDPVTGWCRCSVAFTPTAAARSASFIGYPDSGATQTNFGAQYTGDGTSGIYVWGAQLEQSAAATNYQKVVSLYDITEAGVQTAYGLYYDGVDDFMVTPTITPGTDKVQVFAGVRKLSDAAQGCVMEFGASAPNGSLSLWSPPFANGGFAFWSKGTLLSSNAYTNTPLSPSSRIISGIGEISTDTAALRINGVQSATSAQDQGTGNYLAYPAYFGRRGGTTLPFNGYTFREIGRFGPNLDAATIANVENWINQNTGAY